MKKFLVAITLILLNTSASTLTENENNASLSHSSFEAALNNSTETLSRIVDPMTVEPVIDQPTYDSHYNDKKTTTLHALLSSDNFSKRIHSNLSTTITTETLLKESAEATTDFKKIVKKHPLFSGAVVISLMGAKRSGACVRFIARQPLLLTLGAIATIGAEKTVSYLEKAYHSVRPLVSHVQKIYSDTLQQTDTLELKHK